MKVYQFASIVDFAHYVETATPQDGADTRAKDKSPEKTWDLNAGYDWALDCAKQGGHWEEGTRAVTAALGELSAPGDRHKTEWRADVAGFLPNIPAAIVGSPLAMLRPIQSKDRKRGGRIIRIGVNASLGSELDGKYVVYRGAALLRAIDELESHGYRVELTADYCMDPESWCAPEGTGEWHCEVTLKAAEQQWSPESVAFALCHPAFSRRLGFRMKECCPVAWKATHWGYGGGTACKGNHDADAPFNVWLPRMTDETGYRTPEQALTTMRALFAKALAA